MIRRHLTVFVIATFFGTAAYVTMIVLNILFTTLGL
ncbi:uncharacterized protein METZ01_LOCUS389904 [marine metagenome]|uniref:Uncharacterized protein n=1 Tax=marine metagenome TaxID=408172 RepID=A0A382US56_9ZZZZ